MTLQRRLTGHRGSRSLHAGTSDNLLFLFQATGMKLTYKMYAMMVSDKEAAEMRERRREEIEQARHDELLAALRRQQLGRCPVPTAEESGSQGAVPESALIELRAELSHQVEENRKLKEKVAALEAAISATASPVPLCAPARRPVPHKSVRQVRQVSEVCPAHAVWGTAQLQSLLVMREEDDAILLRADCTCAKLHRSKTLQSSRKDLGEMAVFVAGAKIDGEQLGATLARLSKCYSEAVAATHASTSLRCDKFGASLSTATDALAGAVTQVIVSSMFLASACARLSVRLRT